MSFKLTIRISDDLMKLINFIDKFYRTMSIRVLKNGDSMMDDESYESDDSILEKYYLEIFLKNGKHMSAWMLLPQDLFDDFEIKSLDHINDKPIIHGTELVNCVRGARIGQSLVINGDVDGLRLQILEEYSEKIDIDKIIRFSQNNEKISLGHCGNSIFKITNDERINTIIPEKTHYVIRQPDKNEEFTQNYLYLYDSELKLCKNIEQECIASITLLDSDDISAICAKLGDEYIVKFVMSDSVKTGCSVKMKCRSQTSPQRGKLDIEMRTGYLEHIQAGIANGNYSFVKTKYFSVADLKIALSENNIEKILLFFKNDQLLVTHTRCREFYYGGGIKLTPVKTK